jgi:hypothetical protein
MSLNTMLAACCALVIAAVAVPPLLVNSTLFIPSKCFAKNWKAPIDMMAAFGQCKSIVDAKGNVIDVRATLAEAAPVIAEGTAKIAEQFARTLKDH